MGSFEISAPTDLLNQIILPVIKIAVRGPGSTEPAVGSRHLPALQCSAMDCRVTLSQINPTLGNLQKNLELHVAEIEAAKQAGSQLVLFPELSLSGYFLKDQTSEIALHLDAPLLKSLAQQSRGISIAAGFVERSPEGRLYNSIGFFEDGALLHADREYLWIHDDGQDAGAAHVIACLAVGGKWPGSPRADSLPASLDIEYIRVWQR